MPFLFISYAAPTMYPNKGSTFPLPLPFLQEAQEGSRIEVIYKERHCGIKPKREGPIRHHATPTHPQLGRKCTIQF